MTTKTSEKTSLEIKRFINAPRARVYAAWTDPAQLKEWWGPESVRTRNLVADPRVGGKFLIVMNVGGQDLPHRGEYLEIERHTRMVFTWVSAHAGEGSRVTLRFVEIPGGQTRLTLEHVGLPDAEQANHHSGWSNILAELSALDGLVT